jgi:hypothetical protein
LVREESLPWFSARQDPYRILYASDLHLTVGNAWKLTSQLAQAAYEAKPHLVLLGGDLVDQVQALPGLTECVRALSAFAPLASVGGNHDGALGMAKVCKAVEKGGGLWLGRESYSFQVGDKKVRVDGFLKPTEERASARADARILCSHFPDPFPRAARRGYRLVLAGHLHGCQFVFWRRQGKLYPGAWFYRWNGLRFQDGHCSLVMSRGVSDSFPLRWDCPREVLLCKVS